MLGWLWSNGLGRLVSVEWFRQNGLSKDGFAESTHTPRHKNKNETYYYMMDPNEMYRRFMIRRMEAIKRKRCYIDIFAFILDRKIDYATNNNGVFFNISTLSNDVIRDIDSIIKKYEAKS